MSGISSLGVGSGLDLQGILDQLLSAEQKRLKPLTDQKTALNNQITAWGIVKSSMSKLDAAAQNLAKVNTLSTSSVSSTNEHFSASVKAGANPGSFSVSVLQLAQAQVSQSKVSAGKEETVFTATDNSVIRIGSTVDGEFEGTEISLKAGDYTLDEIRTEINKSDSDVRAEIVYDGNGNGFLALSSRSTGEKAAFTVGLHEVNGDIETPVNTGKLADIFTSLNATDSQIKTAQDAKIQFNGVTLSSATNTFENVVEGVSVTAKSLTNIISKEGEADKYDAEILTISKDTKELKAAIKAYVDAYNEVQTTIANQTKFVPGQVGEELSSSNGDLMGNTALRGLQNQLRSQVTSVQDGAIATLNSLGIRLNNSGVGASSALKLEIDEAKLDKALEENAGAVVDFFVGDGKTTGYGTNSANQLKSIMDNSTGLFRTQEDSLNSMVRRVEQNIESMTASIEANIERTRIQFEQLDIMMARMNQTSAYLTQQLASLSNQSKQ